MPASPVHASLDDPVELRPHIPAEGDEQFGEHFVTDHRADLLDLAFVDQAIIDLENGEGGDCGAGAAWTLVRLTIARSFA